MEPLDLTSSLMSTYACPTDELCFTCETRGSQILAWSSDEYIGRGGEELGCTCSSSVPQVTPVDQNTVAICSNTSTCSSDTGEITIVSHLHIIVHNVSKDSTVSMTCRNVDLEKEKNITFQVLMHSKCTKSIVHIHVHDDMYKEYIIKERREYRACL